nr:10740_t:CDS:1 [Entrophospora candida]CAG8627800.1 1830_t:CDS:1 [Entrophospora candida]
MTLKIITFENIRNHFLKINQVFDNGLGTHSLNNSQLRKSLFQKYGYQKDALINENKFIDCFQSYLKTPISTEAVKVFLDFDVTNHEFLKINIKSLYLNEVNKVKKIIETNCYKHKISVLQNYFILPSGDISHIQKLMTKIDDKYTERLFEAINKFRNILLLQITKTASIHSPLFDSNLSAKRFSKEQTDILETYYNENKLINKIELSKRVGITVKQLETWLNNRRARSKEDNDNDEGTKKFLKEKMDWDTMFVSIDKGTLTSKDMGTMIFELSNCENEEENSKDVEKQQAIPPENLDEILLNENSPSAVESISTTSRKSLILRSRITKEARKSTAPYSTMTPRIKKNSKHTNVETSTNNPQSPFLNQSLQTDPTFQHSVELANNYSDGLEHTITLITNEEPNLTTTSNSLKARYRPNKNYVRTNASPYLRLSSSDQSSAKGKTSEIMDNINIDLLLSTNPAIFNENQLLLHNTYNTTNNLLFHNSQQSLGEDFMNNSIANIQLGTNYEFEKLQSNNIMIDNWLYDKGESNNNNNPFETTLSGFDVNNYYETNGIVPTNSSTAGNPLFMLPGVEGNNSIDTIHNNNITLNQSSYYFEYNFNPNWVSNEPLNMNYTFLEEDTTLSAPTNNLFSQTNYTVLGQNNISNELNAFSLTNFQEQ